MADDVVWPGEPAPLGAQVDGDATGFAVWAPDAVAVDLCLFDGDGAETRLRLPGQDLGVWHGRVPGVGAGQRYGFRVHGMQVASGPTGGVPAGARFDPDKLLLDPYARAVSGDLDVRDEVFAHSPGDSAASVPRSVVVDDDFDWGDDQHPRVPWSDTVVYELHVKGFTQRNPQVPAELRGSYAGLAHPACVDYLTDLGVTTVELLPVHQFVTEPSVAARGLTNYWGYNSIGFFAPHNGYSSRGDAGGQVREFQQMVKTLHAAGIEVLLDVVYNHTGEGPVDGPTLAFRGYDDPTYYRHRADGGYADLTGCGNTFDASQPPALTLILDSLRYWVTRMHVDGFRFDLAPALARTERGVDPRDPFLSAVGQDPVLRQVKLIAEPWDATAEGYSLGRFPAPWCEWNDRFRDTVRDFWRGRSGSVRDLGYRLSGSSDLYADDGRSPYSSVNFVTAHDGLTLRDLVTYERKHNEANGEHNRDGTADNRSWNCGVEGETDDPAVVGLRHRQVANLMSTLLLSTGVPMLVAGDERGRTQGGNNNAYCRDDETSWLDWSDDAAWPDVHRLTRWLLRLRRAHPVLRQRHFFAGRPRGEGGRKDLTWVHPLGHEMTERDWHDQHLRSIGLFLAGDAIRASDAWGETIEDDSFLWWLNADAADLAVTLPGLSTAYDELLRTDLLRETLDAAHPRRLDAGEVVLLGGRSVALLRAC